MLLFSMLADFNIISSCVSSGTGIIHSVLGTLLVEAAVAVYLSLVMLFFKGVMILYRFCRDNDSSFNSSARY